LNTRHCFFSADATHVSSFISRWAPHSVKTLGLVVCFTTCASAFSQTSLSSIFSLGLLTSPPELLLYFFCRGGPEVYPLYPPVLHHSHMILCRFFFPCVSGRVHRRRLPWNFSISNPLLTTRPSGSPHLSFSDSRAFGPAILQVNLSFFFPDSREVDPARPALPPSPFPRWVPPPARIFLLESDDEPQLHTSSSVFFARFSPGASMRRLFPPFGSFGPFLRLRN